MSGGQLELVELEYLGCSMSQVLCDCSEHLELLLHQRLGNVQRLKLGHCSVVAV